MDKLIVNEIKSLEELTNKCGRDLNNYYHKCYQNIRFKDDYQTQYDFEQDQERANEIILSFVRDYALFDEDNSLLLKSVNLNDYDLFNCCSRMRLGG